MIKTITVGEVKSLLQNGKKVKVKTLNNEYTSITNFVEKGILDTYKVILTNGVVIKVSKEHKFFTNVGWLETKDIIPGKTSILCDDGTYSIVTSVNNIGKYRIVDITVDHPEHCYFGNRMLNHNTGKSLISAQIISETQKRGGLSVFFDSEFAVDKSFWTALGVNIADVNYVPFVTLEELFSQIELCIGEYRKMEQNRLLTIFVDSVAQASTDVEMESDHGVSGYNTGKSIIISKAMRKITGLIAKQRILLVFTNQLRYNMQAGFGQDKWVVPGGKALSFACSVRVRLANLGKLRVGVGDDSKVIGMNVQAQVIKNRCGPNYRTAKFEIHYDSGIQNLTSWLKFMKDHGMITGTKAKYTYKKESGESIEFNTNKFVELINTDPSFKQEVYNRICKEYIMVYRNADSKIIEDVEETNSENDDITKNSNPEAETIVDSES